MVNPLCDEEVHIQQYDLLQEQFIAVFNNSDYIKHCRFSNLNKKKTDEQQLCGETVTELQLINL